MRKILLGILAAAAIALSILGFAGSANAGTTVSGHDAAIQQDRSADFRQTTTTNANWRIVTTTLVVDSEKADGVGGIVTFVYNEKTPVAPVQNRVASATGTVTHWTIYGTSTNTFVAPAGTPAPFSFVGGKVVADQYSPAAMPIKMAQWNMLQAGGQNAGYWIPANG